MKKTIFILMLLVFVGFGSCSSDDSSPPELKELVLSADRTTIDVNETVNFKVFLDGNVVSDAEIYANSVKISYTHTFDAVGEYTVIAKKSGAKESNTVVITVKEGGAVGSLVLTADKETVEVGEKVTFNVLYNNVAVTDATLYANDVLINYQYEFATEGEYRIIAKKANIEDSNIITITVKEKDNPEPPDEPSRFLGKWTPTTFVVTLSGIPVPGGSLVYPHKEGCDEDTVELLENEIAIFVSHQSDCSANSQIGNWSEDGDTITIPLMGTSVEAKVKQITANLLIVEVDVYSYRAIVALLFPEMEQYIVQGMKADIKFVK